MRIDSLHFYPVKSCAPITVNRLPLDTAGPLFDREWMIVDEAGKFVTQRDLPLLSQVKTEITKQDLVLSFDGRSLALPLLRKAPLRSVKVFDDSVNAEWEGAGAEAFLEQALGKKLTLVRFGSGQRVKNGKNGPHSVRFPDRYPLHLCSLESLGNLNSRLPAPVEVMRFRPNIVIAGAPAFAEDGWEGIRIGKWEFPFGHACTRCSITTVDPANGQKGAEPLKTLSTFRRKDGKVEFGQYLLSVAGATLEVGMEVEGF